MIKLKVGDNYLLVDTSDIGMKDYIVYAMSSFNNSGKVLLGADILNRIKNLYSRRSRTLDYLFDDYVNTLVKDGTNEVFLLVEDTREAGYKRILQEELLGLIYRIQSRKPDMIIKVIKINEKNNSREYKLGNDVYDALIVDDKSILHHLDKLDEYKTMSNRYKAIPAEIKVVQDSIKQLSKEKKVTDKKTTLKDLEYLNLIDRAMLEGDTLVLDIKPLPIYPSEPLGLCMTMDSFETNPYLFKAASYIYQGCHFGMVGTKIKINPSFRPEFIETLDHTFDDMFNNSNWSTIGYLHFGKNHLCGGEFNDVMAHTSEHGLEYYFICLKQYITTANMRDYAGRKVWWYPIYNDKNELVYCAGYEILKDYIASRARNTAEIKNMTLQEFINYAKENRISFSCLETRFGSSSPGTYSGKEDTFLKVCERKDPELYAKIKKGARI